MDLSFTCTLYNNTNQQKVAPLSQKTPPPTTGPQFSDKPRLKVAASTVAIPSVHSDSTLLQSSSVHLGSFSLDMEMSESQSTGEIPSQITFRYVHTCVYVYIKLMYIRTLTYIHVHVCTQKPTSR